MNLAAVWKLPVCSSSRTTTGACRHRSASSTPAPTWSTGPPATACPASWSTATTCWRPGRLRRGRPRRARAGKGPTLLECKTFRMRGHEEASGNDYVPAGGDRRVGRAATRSPAFEARLDEPRPAAAPPSARVLREELRAEVDALVAAALAAPAPATTADDELGPGVRGRRPRSAGPTGAPVRFARRRAEPARCATSTPCATPCGWHWRATTGWCCWARTSPATAACSRPRRACVDEFGPSGCATRRSSSRAPSVPPSGWRSPGSGRSWRCSSATSCPAGSTSSSTTWPPPATAGAPPCPWSSACRWAAASAPGRSTPRTSRRGSATCPG